MQRTAGMKHADCLSCSMTPAEIVQDLRSCTGALPRIVSVGPRSRREQVSCTTKIHCWARQSCGDYSCHANVGAPNMQSQTHRTRQHRAGSFSFGRPANGTAMLFRSLSPLRAGYSSSSSVLPAPEGSATSGRLRGSGLTMAGCVYVCPSTVRRTV